MRRRTSEPPEIDITPMIDCVFQLILFFMVIIALVVVMGIAIRFPESQQPERSKKESQEKTLFAYVEKDLFDENHSIIRDGLVKIGAKEFAFHVTAKDSAGQDKQYTKTFDQIKAEIKRLVKEEGYKDDQILITGDVISYHWKIVKIIDLAKQCDVKGFSLVPPG